MEAADIAALAVKGNELYFTPGTGAFSQENKHSTAGTSWIVEFGFSFPGPISEQKEAEIRNCGAAVLRFTDGQVKVIHRNDRVSNARMKPDIQSNMQKTVVKFNINSLYCL